MELDCQSSPMRIEGKEKLGVPYWPPTPVGTNSKVPGWQPSPMGIEGKEKLGAPDCTPTPVGTISKAPAW